MISTLIMKFGLFRRGSNY